MVGYRIRQIRMVYLVGFTALLLAGTGATGFAAQSSGRRTRSVNPGESGSRQIRHRNAKITLLMPCGQEWGLSWMAAGFMRPIIPGMS